MYKMHNNLSGLYLKDNEITDKQIVEEENVWKLFWIN